MIKDVKYFIEKSCSSFDESDIFDSHYLLIDEECDTIEDIIEYENIYELNFGKKSSKKLMVLPDLTPLIGYNYCESISFSNCIILEEDMKILSMLNINSLMIYGCDGVVGVLECVKKSNIKNLSIYSNNKNYDLSILKNFVYLEELFIEMSIIDLTILEYMTELKGLYLTSGYVDCGKIFNKKLQNVIIKNSEDIFDITFLKKLKMLLYLDISKVVSDLDYSPILTLDNISDISVGKYDSMSISISDISDYLYEMKKEIFHDFRILKIKKLLE